MSESEPRTYGGEGAYERRERRRAQLLDAVADIVLEDGIDSLAVRRICRIAQLNDRYFYESFASVDAALEACFDRAIAEMLSVLAATSMTPGTVRVRVALTVTTCLQHLADHPADTAVMLAARRRPSLDPRRQRLISQVADLMISVAAGPHPTPPATTAVRLSALTLINGSLETLSMWLTGEINATRDDINDHLIRTLVVQVPQLHGAGQEARPQGS